MYPIKLPSGSSVGTSPHNHDDIYYRKNTVDILLDNKASLSYEHATTGDVSLYIDAVTGNDTNDGIAPETALQTIGAAIAKIPQIVNHTVMIHVVHGHKSDEVITLSGISGKGTIKICGGKEVEESQNYVVKQVSIHNVSIPVQVTGIRANIGDGTAFYVTASMSVKLYGCSAVTPISVGGCGVEVLYSNVTTDSCEFSNKERAVIAKQCAIVLSKNNIGIANHYALSSFTGATVVKLGTQPEYLIAAELTEAGGVIRT
ncbi:hypothetical protein DFP93_101256 [Aneurinibacillus soli]|uniref:Uncharacterized protein n=1 Tax=Aneurinibacillus soli TaxID=1500254 RepID=A0A0U5C7I2_9BACL|nr:hypothetical protein [Aneurinibacillus soli]PYE64230.1 hypothetical protein DFP93_101256 [Aneurinibacillus soli]BAU28179.1 hypothetical protein CB4_02353 [Aneurinibacillus soli]